MYSFLYISTAVIFYRADYILLYILLSDKVSKYS